MKRTPWPEDLRAHLLALLESQKIAESPRESTFARAYRLGWNNHIGKVIGHLLREGDATEAQVDLEIERCR